MSRITARRLKGFRDTLPAEMSPQQAMIRTIEDTFERHGFSPLDTPVLEHAEILAGKYGEEGDKLLYRFDDRGGRPVAMRYDLTVPLARVVAEHGSKLPTPFRRYQVGKVWRADKPQRGRFREFMQCDVDICGSDSMLADAEVLVCGLSVLRALGIEGFRLHLNHRELLRSLLAAAGVDGDDRQAEALRAIDKWDKVGRDGVAKELATSGLAAESVERVLAGFAGRQAGARDELARLAPLVGENGAPAVARLSEVLGLLEAAGYGDCVAIDPTIARGLDYYTGVIYETRLTDPKVAAFGAVMSGGRYDGLIGMFSKQSVPAVGISVGLSRLRAAMDELTVGGDTCDAPAVHMTVFDSSTAPAAFEVAQMLRDAGIAVEVSLRSGKLGKQFSQADRRGCRFAVVIGPDEAANRVAKLKDMGSGEQIVTGWGKLAGEISHRLSGNQ
jgi:histidyl-tRNA synthetase